MAARLSPVLRRKPRRPQSDGAGADEQADAGSEVIALPHFDDDPFSESVAVAPLPQFADDPEPLAGDRTARPVTWLHRARSHRWRRALRSATAWIVTLAVIMTTVGVAALALIGPERALQLVSSAQGQLTVARADAAATLSALLNF